jgi:acid stress-induced BolA-like protein IbaG/YrbA
MTLQILSTPSDQTEKMIKEAIEQAIPGATVEVKAGGAGHFQLRVEAEAFAGQSRVAQQRLVYAAIAHLMSGETAPVHAIDKMEIRTPSPGAQ